MVVKSVPAKVMEFENEAVLPLVIVNVPVVLEIVRPLTVVAVAAPRVGVTKVGLLAKASVDPEPVVVAAMGWPLELVAMAGWEAGNGKYEPKTGKASRTRESKVFIESTIGYRRIGRYS